MVLEKIGEKALSSANSLRSEVNDFGKSFTYIYIYIYIYGMFFSKDVQYLLMLQITFKYKGMSLFYLIFICKGKQQIDSAQT